MARCTDNPATGRQACGAEFGGELQHCVAKVSWSTHPDGLAHITAVDSTIAKMWMKGKGGEPVHPAALGYVLTERGVWRMPSDGSWVERRKGAA